MGKLFDIDKKKRSLSLWSKIVYNSVMFNLRRNAAALLRSLGDKINSVIGY